MEIQEFLRQRFQEYVEMADGEPWHVRAVILEDYQAKLRILEWHNNWPVLLEGPPEVTRDDFAQPIDKVVFQISRQIEWITHQEYVKRFGPKSAIYPVLQMMAAAYSNHEDYDEEWKLE